MDTRRYLTLSSGGGSEFPWPPADREPYTLPPYVGDRDLWFTPPQKPDIRFCRGDEWSTVVKGLPYLPGISSYEYPERCLTGFYPLWDSASRKNIRDTFRKLGYTHITLWAADIYRALGVTPQRLLDYCLELWRDGFWIRMWLGSKNVPEWIPRDSKVDVWKARLDPYLDLLLKNDCLHHAVIGGEFDLWNIGLAYEQTPFDIADYLVQKCGPYGCLVYFHFSTHVTFWGNMPGVYKGVQIVDRFGWYKVMCDLGLRGIGYQGACPKEWTIPDLQARLTDTLGKADPRFDIILEEPGPADAQFPKNEHPNELECCQIGYAGVITKPLNMSTNVNIQGFANGGYQPSGKFL